MGAAVKKQLWFLVKLGISAGVFYLIYRQCWQRQDGSKLLEHLSHVQPMWLLGSALSLCAAITCSILRWQRLLVGQGIHAPWGHLIGTFLIGRFFGAVTPSGIGLSGYRIYDITKFTGKAARVVASIGVEMLLGNLALGTLIFLTCFYGIRYVGAQGVTLIAAGVAGVISVILTVLLKPRVVRLLAQRLPYKVTQRIQSLVDAVCAYEGKTGLLIQATLLGVGTHAFNAGIYVCAGKALGVQLPVMELMFVSVLQNVAAHLPLSINGVGLRESAALGLYSLVGVPSELAVLIPVLGFVAVEMVISALCGLALLARKADYAPAIRVDDAEREQAVAAQIQRVPESEWPRVSRGAAVGLGAGLFAGLLVGLGEAIAIAAGARGQAEPDLWFFGVTTYSVFCGLGGLAAGAALAWSGRKMQRAAVPEPTAFAHLAGAAAGLFSIVIGAFRVQRDVYQEELVWKSAQGAMVLGGALLAGAAVYALLFFVLRALTSRSPARALLKPLGSLGFTALAIGAALAVSFTGGEKAAASKSGAEAKGPSQGSNVLFIVVDTLRADHLPLYGYSAGKTPNLDTFAKDAVRFEQCYANASWTRPSFATLLTGRYASSHGVMSKAASLPDAADTIAETFARAGYATGGIVTNYNVAPFFNFQQGFDEYHYLPPNFLFGASDTSAKLSLLQVLRRVDEKARAALGRSEPGSAYQDAAVVNGEISRWLERSPRKPWLLFVGYMDPHDPYYEHPYHGVGYSRAAHIKPDPSEAERLRKLYDGEISFWDEHFGKLMAELKQRGLYEDLTIVVTADHGEEFMEHGGFWHGTTLYDEQLHVPLLIKLPKRERAGTSVSHWVEAVDIMPTLLGLQKIGVPEAVQGVDLFRGKEQTFAEESHEGNVLRALRMRENGTALKLITANADNPRGLKPQELYRVESDPHEQKDLSSSDPAALASSEKQLEQAGQQARTGALKAREVDLAMDKAAQERLKALGYAGE